MTGPADKAALRRAALARRIIAASAGAQDAATARLRQALAPHAGRMVAGYVPMRGEIDPLPALAAQGGRLCLPVVTGTGQPLRFRTWRPGAELVPAIFGTHVPAEGEWCRPDILVVPLLAFDRQGHRLGYGGGFYDRTLAALRNGKPVLAIGFAWAAQETGALPAGPHDQHLDLIVTEREVIRPA